MRLAAKPIPQTVLFSTESEISKDLEGICGTTMSLPCHCCFHVTVDLNWYYHVAAASLLCLTSNSVSPVIVVEARPEQRHVCLLEIPGKFNVWYSADSPLGFQLMCWLDGNVGFLRTCFEAPLRLTQAKETLDFREMKESLSSGMPKIVRSFTLLHP